MPPTPLHSRVAARRVQAGLTQDALAARVAISRQALGLIEAGRSIPSTALALRLARTFACSVEDLFSLDDEAPAPLAAQWIGGADCGRGVLAQVGERLVAHALDARSVAAADVRRVDGQIQALDPGALERAPRRLVIAGCAPALELLVDHLGRTPAGIEASFCHATTDAALGHLARGEVHVAGVHFAAPRPRRRTRANRTLTFARWHQGLLVRRGDRRAPRAIADLGRPGLRLARREAGASANRLLDAQLAAAGIRFAGPSLEVRGHFGVAQAIALGAADVGVAAQHAALAHDLDFIPLDEERFDLMFHDSLSDDSARRLERLGDLLTSRTFRSDLAGLGGYDTRTTGDEVTA